MFWTKKVYEFIGPQRCMNVLDKKGVGMYWTKKCRNVLDKKGVGMYWKKRCRYVLDKKV